MNLLLDKISRAIAADIHCTPAQAAAAVNLLEEGATVPFIARYRKEVTGGLDDTQLRALEEKLIYLKDLEDRRASILESIEKQGKLTDALRAEIESADSKQRLEDLYLPYKPKRRTRAEKAREAGLEPLADQLLGNPSLDPEETAKAFLSEAYPDPASALDGARDIAAERFATDAELIGKLRDFLWKTGVLQSEVIEGQEEAGSKYQDYFHFSEPLIGIPSHRVLAIFRARTDEVLSVKVALPEELETQTPHPCIEMVAEHEGLRLSGAPASSWYARVCRWTWRVKCLTSLETEIFQKLHEDAERSAITVFGSNLKDLLLAAPAGHKGVIGLDPGIRTGVKVAVISETGSVQATAVIYPHPPRNDWDGSIESLATLARRFHPSLVSIGNGTASRETVKLVDDLIHRHPELGLTKAVVSEAGASVYSASELAAKEFPDMDVSYRGAVSIARRLQDPLAELVKIDPKAIGVGQYQHDVDQGDLARKLDAVVEDCVNSVGVNLNTASPMLLRRVAGLTSSLAEAVVRWREAHGAFASRAQLLSVPRLGQKTFEQAAGFLRIQNGENPLDASAVHPEAYSVANAIAEKTGLPIEKLIGNESVLKRLRPADFVTDQFGLPTVKDILSELEKPGRDPRPEFVMAHFLEGVTEISDLKPGMKLEGVVSNVTAFGAFVDIGVHQDGLVHISELADHYVNDPSAEVRVGQIVKVRVLDVDEKRKRIALSMRREGAPRSEPRAGRQSAPRMKSERTGGGFSGAMAAAFQNASGNPRRK